MSRTSSCIVALLGATLLAALLSVFATPAAAERITTSQVPLAAVLLSPCTGDVVTFTGTAVLTVTEADNLSVHLSGQVQDPHATGLLYPYNFKDQLSSADVVRVDNVYKATFTDRMHFIRLGSGGDQKSDDLFVTAVIAATIDSNLVLKADRIDYQVDCQ
jgi:hypothetical protein